MDTRQFIDQITAGEVASAKDTLDNILSARAFEALDVYKKDMSSGIFGGQSDETDGYVSDDFENDDDVYEEEVEELDEVLDTPERVSKYVGKASDSALSDSSKLAKRATGIDRAQMKSVKRIRR